MRRPWWRIVLKVAGALLTFDAVFLMVFGVFDIGVFIPLGIGTVLLVLSRYSQAVARWCAANRRNRRIWAAGWIVFAAWLLTVALFIHGIPRATDATNYSGPPPAAIIVLGSGTADCQIHPILIGRLDEGVTQAQRWPRSKVVVSGGEGVGLECREADIMAAYLSRNGVTLDRVIRERLSWSTSAGILFSRVALQGQGVTNLEPVVVVTSDFHVPRAKRLARRAGFKAAAVVGVSTPWPIFLNASLQEYFASMNSRIFDE